MVKPYLQIRKSLKKKHTLPFYKVRYKPFFVKPDIDLLTEEEETQPGVLEFTIVEATRLTTSTGPIFCNVAIGELSIKFGYIGLYLPLSVEYIEVLLTRVVLASEFSLSSM